MKALSSHTRCEWSFVCLDSSGDSKGRAQWLVSLSTVHSNMARNIKHIKSANILCVDHLPGHANWNFLTVSEGAWKLLAMQSTIQNQQHTFTTQVQFFFFFVLKHIIQHENSNKVFEEGEEDMRDLHRVVSCCGFHFYISPWTHTRALMIVYISPCRDSWSESWCEIRRREGVLIYDNSYNMPPVMHYHPHQTTTKREGLKAGGRAITRTTQRAIILTT